MSAKIALTFDVEREKMCSSSFRIPLDLLEQYSIRGTFFVLGRFSKNNPAVVKEICSRNHEVGCHGYSHFPPYDKRAIADVMKDVERGSKEIQKICHIQSFRSPYFRPHRNLPLVLERLNYKYDSSVPSKRFDFFIGRTTNPNNLLCPLKLYHPSVNDVFTEGNSKITEAPLSSLILPLSGVSMRIFGLRLFLRLAEMLVRVSGFLVFDFHTWEFGPPTDRKSRHRFGTGRETELRFKYLLEHFRDRGEFTTLSDLCRSARMKT